MYLYVLKNDLNIVTVNLWPAFQLFVGCFCYFRKKQTAVLCHSTLTYLCDCFNALQSDCRKRNRYNNDPFLSYRSNMLCSTSLQNNRFIQLQNGPCVTRSYDTCNCSLKKKCIFHILRCCMSRLIAFGEDILRASVAFGLTKPKCSSSPFTYCCSCQRKEKKSIMLHASRLEALNS